MKIDSVIKLLVPKDRFFFDILEKASKNLIKVTYEFRKFGVAEEKGNFATLSMQIKDLEHEGDKMTYRIFEALNKSFITPLDREDIKAMTTGIDDIIDIIDSIAARVVLYKINRMTDEMIEMIEILYRSVEEIDSAVCMLKDHSKCTGDVHETFKRIHKLEEEGDRIYRMSIAKLFEKEKDPITLIKLKEIYEAIERSIDMCKVTGDTIETVFMKNA